ncbi:MAG TPA: hypothetical protein VG939_02645, partial [Caulobacteraceae bacterium]|nr:hypothetical protein [Caulobacteraceae bacterium]
MDPARILAEYDAQMRADPPPETGVERVWADGVLRTLGTYNFIGWWDLWELDAPEAARREAAFFRGRGEGVEWKVYSHDRPAGMDQALQRAGFVCDDAETFLALDLEAIRLDATPPAGIEVRRVGDRAGVEDLVEANAAAFGHAEPWRVDALVPRLDDGSLGLYVAYADGRPISSGRLELAPGRAFAGLYGGGTAPEHRGRGVYRALVA